MADDSAKEYLIELVRARKVLYSKAHQDFKDSRTVKRNNWDDVAKEMAKEHPTKCGNWKGKTVCANKEFPFFDFPLFLCRPSLYSFV